MVSLRRPHYAWIICLGGALSLFAVMGMGINVFSVYQPYIIQLNGFSNAQGSWITTTRSLFSFFVRACFEPRVDVGFVACCREPREHSGQAAHQSSLSPTERSVVLPLVHAVHHRLLPLVPAALRTLPLPVQQTHVLVA